MSFGVFAGVLAGQAVDGGGDNGASSDGDGGRICLRRGASEASSLRRAISSARIAASGDSVAFEGTGSFCLTAPAACVALVAYDSSAILDLRMDTPPRSGFPTRQSCPIAVDEHPTEPEHEPALSAQGGY